jgi:hypothetical protein
MSENKEITVYDRLKALYKLQVIDSKIDELRRLRGDTPLKVKDLEDEIIGLKTRAEKIDAEIKILKDQIVEKKEIMAQAKEKLKKYEEQQKKVRNNREYESLMKQIEYEELEMQLSEKRIKEYTTQIKEKEEALKQINEEIKDRNIDYENAQKELTEVVEETEKDEQKLRDLRTGIEETIERRLLKAYIRIRKGVRNGLAVVPIQRQSCGGCFNKIPPQREIDVQSHKKIIVCDFCGRILVDDEIVETVTEEIKQLNIDIKLYD